MGLLLCNTVHFSIAYVQCVFNIHLCSLVYMDRRVVYECWNLTSLCTIDLLQANLYSVMDAVEDMDWC